jgi:hypothetical protein
MEFGMKLDRQMVRAYSRLSPATLREYYELRYLLELAQVHAIIFVMARNAERR